MEQRTLGLTVISAKGLKYVKHLRSMHLYASVTISGGASKTTFKTPVDYEGCNDPVWNFSMKFMIDEKEIQSNSLVLVFKIWCSRAVRGDKEVGDVHVPIKDLLDKSNDSSNSTTMTLQVRAPFSGPEGVLTFSYAFDQQQPSSRSSLLQTEAAEDQAHKEFQPVVAQPFVVPNGAQVHAEVQPVAAQPFIVPNGYAYMAGYSQTTVSCVVTSEPPLGYPPLGPQVVFPQQVMMPMAYPPAMNSVAPYPPSNPTVAPPIATDSPVVLSGIPGVDTDREKTEYELQLENALTGLLQAIGALEVEDDNN